MSAPVPGRLIARGRTAEVYAWGDGQVVKLFYDWCRPEWAQHEVEIGRAVSATTLPTPKLIDALEIDGRQGIVYQRVDGPSMLSLSNAKPWLLARLARQLAELHSEIHRQPGTGLPPLHPALQRAIQGARELPAGLQAGVLQVLEKLPAGGALCHCDFHPDQVLVTARGPVIIDWMTALQGDPLADVARTCILLQFGQVPYAGRAMRAFVDLWRGLFLRRYLACYLELHPDVTRDEVRTWMIPVAAARLEEKIPGEKEPLLSFIRSALPMQQVGHR